MPTLQEMLDDASIADELEISFGDKGRFKVADLRAADKSRKTKAAEAEATQRKAMETIAAKQKELETLATEAAALVEKMKKEPEPVRTSEGDLDFDADPIYGPLMKKVLKPFQDDYKKKSTELESAIKQLTEAQAQMAKIGLMDRYEAKWNAIPADRRPKDKGWKDYLKVAQEKSILDAVGLPDPVEAWNREQAPIEKDALTKQIASLTAEVESLKRNGPRTPRPGAAGVPGKIDKDAKPFASADELVDAAFNDPLIQEIASGAGRA